MSNKVLISCSNLPFFFKWNRRDSRNPVCGWMLWQHDAMFTCDSLNLKTGGCIIADLKHESTISLFSGKIDMKKGKVI